MSDTASQTNAELKRLAPVATAASSAANAASLLHSRALSYVPDTYKPILEEKEQALAALASPYVSLLSDRVPALLLAADTKVDGAILSAWNAFTANRATAAAAVEHTKAAAGSGLEQLSAARDAYLKRVEDSVAYVREQGLQGAAKAATEALLSKVEEAKQAPAAVLHEISEAWAKLAAMPAVERVLAASRSQVEAAYTRYQAVHDALVADPRYASAVAKGSQLLATVQETTAFKAAAGRLSPLLAPYAETAARLAGPYVAKAAAHLAPVTA